MRILHIWNTAGVASIIAKYMDRLFGTKSLVVHRRIFDPYGFTTYGELWDCGAKMFAFKCFRLARKFDIIHVHSLDKLVPFLKSFYFYKPVVIHYWGNDIRGKWILKRKYWSKADLILFSTLDLLSNETPKNAIHVPCPVDTELFHRSPHHRNRNVALAFDYYVDKNKAEIFAKKYGLSIEYHERNIPYMEMPAKLNEYEYYLDKTEISSLSKTALEALACGLKVIRWDGNLIEELPMEHRPTEVVRKIWEIYQGLIKK